MIRCNSHRLSRREVLGIAAALPAVPVLRVSSSLSSLSWPAGFHVIRGQRQLFVDDQGMARIENLRRTAHRPVKKGAVIRPSGPVETALQTRSAPAWNPEREVFQLWMLTSTSLPGVGGTTYAESPDGLHWVKPILRQKEVNGS